VVTHPTPAPGTLDAVLAEPDAGLRLQRLSEYIDRGERQLYRARAARREVVALLRADGTRWPKIITWAGVSESYLRRESKR
jgi:hypothetical protein